MSGVTGSSSPGIPGNIRDQVTAVTASAENAPGETAERLNDGDVNSKWLAFESDRLDPLRALRAGGGRPLRARPPPTTRPSATRATGSSRARTTAPTGPRSTRRATRTSASASRPRSTASTTTRRTSSTASNITANHSGGLTQLAELQLSDGDTTPPPATDMKAVATSGPVNGPTMKPGAGWTGMRALRYSGGHTAEGRGYAYDKVFDVDVEVTRNSELSYLIFPELTNNDLGYPSTYAAVDLAFTDGTYLSELRARDQQEYDLDPQGQGASQVALRQPVEPQGLRHRRGRARQDDRPHPRRLRQPARARTCSTAGSTTSASSAARPRRRHARPSDWVLTTRGTNSTGGFSRGNNIPATAVPHGFNFWTPMTDAGSLSWLYAYQQDNNDDNLPEIEAFAASHEPSPWMGDRQTFQVMPSPDRSRPARRARSPSGTRTRSPSRTATASSSRTGCAPTSRRPTTPRSSASSSPATRATSTSTTSTRERRQVRAHHRRGRAARSAAGPTRAAGSPTAPGACSSTARSTSR